MWYVLLESAKLRALRALAPTRFTHHWYASHAPRRLRASTAYSSLIRVYAPLLSPISALRAVFVLFCVASILRYDLRLKNPRKGTGPDFIHLKVIKLASDVIDSHLHNIIWKDLEKNKYPDEPKTTALVRPIFNKYDRNNIGNYRSVRILNRMPKIYERCIDNSLSSFAEKMLSNFIPAYKKSYSLNHVLLRLIFPRKLKIYGYCSYGSLQGFWLYSFRLTCCKTSRIWFIRGCSNFCTFILKTGGKYKLHWECFSNICIRYTTRFYIMPHFIQYLYKSHLFSLLKTFNLQILQMTIQYMQPGIV